MKFPFGATVERSQHSFALTSFHALLNEHSHRENICYSPFGVQTLLTILYELAASNDRQAIAALFDYEGEGPVENMRDIHRRRRAYNELEGVSAHNSIWLRTPLRLTSETDSLLRNALGCDCFTRDFNQQTVTEINRWAATKTAGRIGHIVSAVEAVLMAVSAVYFKRQWDMPFKKDATRLKPFTLEDGTVVERLRMSGQRWCPYYEDGECQAVDLHYDIQRFYLRLVLPKRGVFVPGLLRGTAKSPSRGFKERPGWLEWPRFNFEAAPHISPEQFGLTNVLSLNGPAFSTLTADGFPIQFNQRTWIAADEEGTEAAAMATVQVFSSLNHREPPKPKPFEMIVDRPFYFLICDQFNDLVLFIGRVADPLWNEA